MFGYHGGQAPTPHIGFCLADSPITAARYRDDRVGPDGQVVEAELNLDGELTVIEVEYDFDATEPVLDDANERGADVVEYLDQDPQGHDHRAWMLLTDRAVAACTVTGALTEEEIYA